MQLANFTVQACGCLALPEQLVMLLGMSPGGVVSVELNGIDKAVILRVAEAAPDSAVALRPACFL